MPAVTVDSHLQLPRVPTTDPAIDQDRPVVSITTAPTGFEGEGFPVRRAFAGVDLRVVGWILMLAGVAGLVLFFYFWNRRRAPGASVTASRIHDDAGQPPV